MQITKTTHFKNRQEWLSIAVFNPVVCKFGSFFSPEIRNMEGISFFEKPK